MAGGNAASGLSGMKTKIRDPSRQATAVSALVICSSAKPSFKTRYSWRRLTVSGTGLPETVESLRQDYFRWRSVRLPLVRTKGGVHKSMVTGIPARHPGRAA